MSSQRLQILQDLQAQLETIRTVNTYNTDIGDNVVYWEVYEIDYNGPAILTFRDIETEYQFDNVYYLNKLIVELEAIGYTQETTKMADSCNILDDIYAALITQHWSDNILVVRPKTDSKFIQGKGKQVISIIFKVEIEYKEYGLL